MGKGIIGTVQLLAAVVLAVPVGMMGASKLFAGQTLVGGGFLVLAILMIVVEEYITTPSDVPAEIAETTARTVVKSEDGEE